MKVIYKICLLSLLISSCSFEQSEVSNIEIKAQFATPEENEQLIMDLLTYKYGAEIQKKYPNISEAALNNTEYHYYLDEDGEVSLRITLTNEAIGHKTTILTFFKRTANTQANKQVTDKLIFEEAIDLTKEYLTLIDARDIDNLWNRLSAIFKNMTTKEAFLEAVDARNDLAQKGVERNLRSQVTRAIDVP